MNFRSHHRKRICSASCEHTLSALETGQTGRIKEILGGWHLRQSLHQVGIHVGDFFLVERGAHLGGPTLILIHSVQVALGHGMTEKIVVQVDENTPLS